MFKRKKENRAQTSSGDTGCIAGDVQERDLEKKCIYAETEKDVVKKSRIIINQNKSNVSFGATLQTCIILDVEKCPYYYHTLVDVHPETAGQMQISNGDELILLNDMFAPEETHAELENIFRCLNIDGKARILMVIRRRCELPKTRKLIRIELVLSTAQESQHDGDAKTETKPSSNKLVVDEIKYEKWRGNYINMNTFHIYKIPGTKLFLAIKDDKVAATTFTSTEDDKTSDLDQLSKRSIISIREKICKRKCVSRDEHHNVQCVTALCDETMMNYITVNSYGNIVVSNCPQWWHVIRRDNNIAFKLENKYLAYDQKENCVTAQRTEYLFEECTLEHCSDDLAGKKHYGPDSGYSSPFDTPCCSERDNDIPHLFNIFNKFDESEDKSSKESQAESYSNKLREISKKLAEEHIPAPTQNSLKSTVSDHSGKHVLCDEIRSWEKCIKEQDETGICSLIERRILPDKDDLDLACFKFGRRSQTFTNILTFICEYIKSQSSDVLNVWASYDAQQCENSGIIHTIFVIITKTDAAYVGELRYTRQRQKTEISMESKVVMESRLSDIKQKKKSDIKESSLDELSNCVTKNAEYLMEKHSNISAICPSTKKSTGFGTQDHKIIDVPCITIYVHVKGLTPIREDPFPKQICGYPTDVIEESLLSFHGGPNVYHNNLKMGMAIHANIRTPEDDILSGTLGCFLDHKEFGLCCITSSHFLLTADEMNHFRSKDGLNDLRYLNRCVHQPCGEMNYMTSFGHIISVAYRLGDMESPGVEAALIQILQRHPLKGDFPDADNYDDAGFDESKPLLFDSGQVLTVSHKHMNLIVYKFGMNTGCTRGCIGVRGASIRKTEVKEDTCIYQLRNQLEILPVGGLPFATEGDSGALVMIEGEANDSIAIGIVTGGFLNGTVFVTPICAILDAFGCPHSLKVFKDKAETVSLMSHDSGISGSEAMEFTSSEI